MTYATIKFDIKDGVGKITLNRPDKLNSFSDEMHEELRSIMPQLEGDEVRAVLITGEGRAFGAGADLSSSSASGGGLDAGETLEKNYNPLILFVRNLNKPVVAAVNGLAAGASRCVAITRASRSLPSGVRCTRS